MAPPNSAPWKKKRAKLLDVLQNANWSKQSQQAANIIKLHKILLVCDANFLDEKSGESPLTLAISSPSINPHLSSGISQPSPTEPVVGGHGSSLSGAAQTSAPLLVAPAYCPPQSASLFDLQCQSTGLNQHTSISDLSHSQAPLIERLILLFYKCGAQLDFRNKDGRTPLHLAAMKSNFWALNMLLELGKYPFSLIAGHRQALPFVCSLPLCIYSSTLGHLSDIDSAADADAWSLRKPALQPANISANYSSLDLDD